MKLRALAIPLLLVLGAPAFGDDSPAPLVADGQPWTTTGPNGGEMQITFFPDGSVRMHMGFLSRSMNWAATPDGMCLTGSPGGDRCITLIAQGDGFVGTSPDGETLVLKR